MDLESKTPLGRLKKKGSDREFIPHPGESLHASTSALSFSGSAIHLARTGLSSKPGSRAGSRQGSRAGGLDRVGTNCSAGESISMAAMMLDKKRGGAGERHFMPHPGESLHASTSHLSFSGSALHLGTIGHKGSMASGLDQDGVVDDEQYYAPTVSIYTPLLSVLMHASGCVTVLVSIPLRVWS